MSDSIVVLVQREMLRDALYDAAASCACGCSEPDAADYYDRRENCLYHQLLFMAGILRDLAPERLVEPDIYLGVAAFVAPESCFHVISDVIRGQEFSCVNAQEGQELVQ